MRGRAWAKGARRKRSLPLQASANSVVLLSVGCPLWPLPPSLLLHARLFQEGLPRIGFSHCPRAESRFHASTLAIQPHS